MGHPQPEPWTTYFGYPNFFIRVSNIAAVSLAPKGSDSDTSLKPKPGMLGHTMWKVVCESCISGFCCAVTVGVVGIAVLSGSINGSMSRNEPGQVWQKSRGIALGSELLLCTKCTRSFALSPSPGLLCTPAVVEKELGVSTKVRNCGRHVLICASCTRQSYFSSQKSMSGSSSLLGVPSFHADSGGNGISRGRRVSSNFRRVSSRYFAETWRSG